MNKDYPDYSVIPTYNKTNKSFKHHEEFNVKIKILNLSMNEITDSSIIEEFKFSLKNSFLLEINFSYNNLGDASVRNFASGLSESHIKKINMTQTKISYIGANVLLRTSSRCKHLLEITLDKNSLDGSKMRSISEMLNSNKYLKTLNMNQCQLGEDGCDWFA